MVDATDETPPASGGEPKLESLSLTELFWGFVRISLSGFGFVLPWARRLIVDQKKWMTADEFNETFSLSQFLPGPNVVNMAVVFGARMGGAAGAVVAFAGLLGPPAIIATFLSFLYSQYGDIDILRRVLTGIAAAAIGLMLATVGKMAEPLLRTLSPAPVLLIVTFVAVGVLRLPLVWCLLLLAPASIAIAFWWQRR